MTKVIRGTKDYIVLHRSEARPLEKVCDSRLEAAEVLQNLGIDDGEIEDAFAAMSANNTNGAEFGVCGTFIRTFNSHN